MCDCLDFISVILDINSATEVVALRISLCDNQAVILPEHNSLTAALKQQDVVPNLAGNGFVVIGQSTSRMRVSEFAELLELIQAFGTERGVKWSDEARLALEWKARWGDRAA